MTAKLPKCKLKSCPFCGGEAKVTVYEYRSIVHCARCGVEKSWDSIDTEQSCKMAIRQWNHRAFAKLAKGKVVAEGYLGPVHAKAVLCKKPPCNECATFSGGCVDAKSCRRVAIVEVQP